MSRLLLALAFVAATAVILVLLTHSIWPFDATLAPTPQTVTALKQMRDEPKFADLPGEQPLMNVREWNHCSMASSTS
jgi:hypothetical protein